MVRQYDPSLPPKPWSYNPSSWNQRLRIAFIAAIATFIALYMGLYQWGLIDDVWDPVFGDSTKKVLESQLSHQITRWIRIPDAILGAIAYLTDIVFALAGSVRRWQDRPWLVIIFGLDVIPLGLVSALLVFAQGTIVGDWCFLCLVTAVISILLIFLAYDEVYSSCLYLYEIWKNTKSMKTVWQAFCGKPSEAALEAGLVVTARKNPDVAKKF